MLRTAIISLALISLASCHPKAKPKLHSFSEGRIESSIPAWAAEITFKEDAQTTDELDLRKTPKEWSRESKKGKLPDRQLKANLDSLPSPSDPFVEALEAPAKEELTRTDAHAFSLIINNNSFPQPEEEKEQLNLSRVESLYHFADGLTRGRGLKQFGYDVIASKIESPLTGAVSADYRLAAFDEISIQVSGSLEVNSLLSIDREGFIFLPEIGPISVAGLTLDEATAELDHQISKEYRDFTLHTSLGKLKALSILVVGMAKNPGLVTIPPSGGLMDVLLASGGISKDGSLRQIQVIRGEKVFTEIDLYALLVGGTLPDDPKLEAGDRIRIPPIGPTAAIIGPIGSHIFELKDEVLLETLTGYLGGINAFTYTEQVLLERTMDRSRRDIRRVDYEREEKTLILEDGDIVQFSNVIGDLNRSVLLSGEVVRPGLYPYEEGMHISDLIERGQGFLLEASLDKALITRRVGASGIYDLMPGDQRGLTEQALIWVDLDRVLSGDEEADIELSRLDTVRILSSADVQDKGSVSIIGAVRRPGTYQLTTEMTLADLIKLAGGPSNQAFKGRSSIMRRRLSSGNHYDISIHSFNLSNVMEDKSEGDILLKNHDQIVIREMQSLQVEAKVEGMVQFPGTYILPQGARISDLISEAGGLIKTADLRAALFKRKRITSQQESHLDHLFTNSKERFSRTRDLVTRDGRVNESVANHLNLLGLDHLEKNMGRFQTSGRIVLDFMQPDFPQSKDNLRLEQGDFLHIPRQMESVVVVGHVFSPNAFIWKKEKKIGDYIQQAGGPQEDADLSQAYAVLSSGEVLSAAQIGFDNLKNHPIGPGDAILVPSSNLGRSTTAVVGDSLALVRRLVEIGLIGSAIPAATDSGVVGLDLGTSPQPIPTAVGRPYDEILSDERIQVDKR